MLSFSSRLLSFLVLLTSFAGSTGFAAPPAAVPIEEGYKLTLKQALQMVLNNSPRLKAAEEEMRAAESGVSSSIGGFLPTVEASVSAGTFHDKVQSLHEDTPPTSARDRNLYEGQVTFRQPLFSGFKNYSTLQSDRSARDAKFWQQRTVHAEVVEDLVVRYFRLQTLQQQLRAEEEIAQLRERQMAEVKQRFNVGRATELERLQAEYATEAQKPQLLSLKADIENSLLELVQLIGEAPAKKIIFSDQLDQAAAQMEKQQLPPLGRAIEMAKANNPKLRQLEAEIRKSEYGAGEVLAKHLPSLDFELLARTSAGLRADVATSDTTAYGGQLKLTIPLFSGLSSFSERHEAASLRLALEHNRERTWDEVVADVNRQYRQWDLAKARIVAEKLNMRLTAQKIRTAESSYRNGRATISELLDSYAQDLAARRNLAQAYLDQVTSVSRIKRLIGVEPHLDLSVERK